MDDRGESVGNFRAVRLNRFRCDGMQPKKFRPRRTIGERGPPRQQEVQRGPETVEIGANVHVVAIDGLFGRQILDRTEDQLFVDHLRDRFFAFDANDAEVENFHATMTVDE
jgi:hypothetical protein